MPPVIFKAMKNFFSFIIRQSVAVVLISAFVLGFGVWSTVNMDVNLLPDINVPMVCVQAVYPGANAASVEKDVTVKLEKGLGAVSGINDVQSYSYDNLSALVMSFDYGIDTAEKKNDINDKLASLDLPSGVTTSVYDVDLNAEALAMLSVTSEQGVDEAYAQARGLAAKISAIDGVEKVEIKGGAQYSYTVKPFGGLELVCPLIVEAFSYGALDLPLGNVSEEDGSVQIRNNSDVKSAEDILAMPIELPAATVGLFEEITRQLEAVKPQFGEPPYSETQLALIKIFSGFNLSNELLDFIAAQDFTNLTLNSEGERVYLTKVGDIATVEKTAAYSSYAYYCSGGKIYSGIVLEVYKANGANASAVVQAVKSEYAQGYTANIKLLDDQSQFISDSVSNVLISMLIGGALAILIIFLFLKTVRTSLVIAITMPLSVLAALICLSLMGITLNMVSLGGLAVGIGMLVDNSIVVIEAISKHRDAGKTAFAAAVDGTSEVGGALFGSTLTTVCVFVPILFVGGLTAEIFTDLAFAVIFSLAFSLIVALTVIPALYALFEGKKRLLKGGRISTEPLGDEQLTIDMLSSDEEFKQHSQTAVVARNPMPAVVAKKKFSFRRSYVMDALTRFYSAALPKILNKKLVTVLTAVAVFGASIGLLFLTGTEFLPSIDKGQIEVSMSYGGGKDLQDIQEDVLSFSEVIAENVENVDYVSASIGKNGILALTDTGIITVQLTTNRRTDRVVEEIRGLAKTHKTEGNVTVRQIDGVVASLMSGADNMSVTIVGSDGERLAEIADKLKTKLAENGFEDITDSATEKVPQYTLQFDRAKLAQYGIDYRTAVLTLRIGLASYTACTVTIDGEELNLDVRFADNAVTGKRDLENFIIGFDAAAGKQVRLKDVLKGGAVTEELNESCIRRSNGNVMVSVSATLPDTDTGAAGKQMQKIAAEVLKEYEDCSFESGGITSYLNDAFAGLAVALAVSFFLLYAVMAIQFGSALKPLIIMASIPFSFTGGFIALVITGTSLNVVSFIGLIMLMGVVVNNAIVMLEKIKQLKNAGMPHYNAVIAACGVRLRPILMTTLTTILALIPMAIGVGQGSELMQPLGIVVIGGLLLGTLVTLVLVPAVYSAVHRISARYPDGKKK